MRARKGAVLAVALSLVSSMVVVPAGAAAAENPPVSQSDGRARVVAIWQTGGQIAKAEAEKVLTGTDAQITDFLTNIYPRVAKLDDRLSVNRMQSAGGVAVKEAAQRALDDGSAGALRAFLENGFRNPKNVDLRVAVNQVVAAGGPQLKAAAQPALDAGTPETLEKFLSTGWRLPFETDLRIRVNQAMSVGGKNVRAGAQQALDAGTAEAYQEFLDIDFAVYQARDLEAATIGELAGVAKEAGEQAAKETVAAKVASERAVKEAELAKAAAEEAARATEAAKGNADEAAAAAGRAASAASAAAVAAREAVNAANVASKAAWTAANAASRAASAASMAGKAASRAFSAAAAVTTDASKVPAARQAAVDAAAVADNATEAAAAAQAAGDAARNAGNAAAAAGSAGDNARAAAQAAGESAAAARRAGADANAASKAAAASRAAAARANRAANAARSFATIAAAAADTAKQAALHAADNARAAAAAANRAADHAGSAQNAAAEATAHADAATQAALNANGAAEQARKIYDGARTSDAERFTVRIDQAREAARNAHDEVPRNFFTGPTWDLAQTARQDEETKQLIAQATEPGASPQVVADKGRQVAMRLARVGGPWTKAAALAALAGIDEEVRAFVKDGIKVAAGQDDRTVLTSLAQDGTDAFRAAAKQALAGSDVEVERFLLERDYPRRDLDDRLQINHLLSQARDAGRLTTRTAAQKALDAGTRAAYRKFLAEDRYTAAGQDERLLVNQVKADPASGPETVEMAQVALDGPPGVLRQFLDVERFATARRDKEQSAHNAEMANLLATAYAAAAEAAQHANEAQAAAATARNAAAEAVGYAQQANEFAQQAATHAQNAQKSANEAAKSAQDAANSARKARTAASAAQASARKASQSAVWAQASAKQARTFANDAYKAARTAAVEALAAGKLAQEAADAAAGAAKRAIDLSIQKKYEYGVQHQQYCQGRHGESGPRYSECMRLLTMTADELVERAYENADVCRVLDHRPGGQGTENCLSMVLHPDFVLTQVIGAVTSILQVYSVVTGGVVAGALMVRLGAACAASEVCGAALVAFTPEAGAYMPWLALSAQGTAASAAVMRTLGELQAVLVTSVSTEARIARLGAELLNRLPGSIRLCRSFAADTPVLMADGSTKPVADIRAGEIVRSANPANGEVDSAAVSRAVVGAGEKRMVDISVAGGGRISATDTHPFWVEDTHSWVHAGDLRIGQHLRTPEGTVAVSSVHSRLVTVTVHNLDVTAPDTFFVVAGGKPVLVHNSECIEHVVLGLREGGALKAFADSIKGNIITVDDYRGVVFTLGQLLQLNSGWVKVSFRMDNLLNAEKGVAAMVNASRLRSARQVGGATDYELSLLYDLGVLKHVNFYHNGKLMPNPYA
ncbi:polymorphic toxin-type HINT domain-containing protein [Crossiella sp. CA-258035]|uniref:polymorphic toxin-type HINT domain-containing protein n=1 Tax=Crossiella sp. CA-258035 TaxID=2981138 RepID=UPI0024BD2A85|nr:polymorphic toxin-type HINT domain-containing protein [Crossiella sp. CA-258035]WHT23404.1 polymorphic toxin-type HINT domain-containing protein [Crossiella sp. CA-258035]